MDINSDKKIINNTQSTIPTKLYFTPDANFIDEINELKNTLAPEKDLAQNIIENPESQMKTDTLLESVVNEFKIKNDGFKVQKTVNQKIHTDNNDKKITEKDCEKIQNETNSEKSPIIQSNPDLNTEDLKEEQPKAILNKENDDNQIQIQNKKHVEQEIDTEKTEIDEQQTTIIPEKNEINHIKKEEKEEFTVKVVSLPDEQTVSEDESFVALNDTHEPIIEPEENLKHIEIAKVVNDSTNAQSNQKSESLKVVDFNKIQEPELKNDIEADMPIIDEEEAITEEIINHKDIEPKIIDDENLKSDIKIDSFDNDVINPVDNFDEDIAVLPQKEDTLNTKAKIKEEPTFTTKYEVDDTVLNKDTLSDKSNDTTIIEEEQKIIKNESNFVKKQVAPADSTENVEDLIDETSNEENKTILKDSISDKTIIETPESQPISAQVEKIASIIEQNTPKLNFSTEDKNEPAIIEETEPEHFVPHEMNDLRQEGTINNNLTVEQEHVKEYSSADKEVVSDIIIKTPKVVADEPQINKVQGDNKIETTEQIKNNDMLEINNEVRKDNSELISLPIELNEFINANTEEINNSIEDTVQEISYTAYSIEKPEQKEYEPKTEHIVVTENQQHSEPTFKKTDDIISSEKIEKIQPIKNTSALTDKTDNTPSVEIEDINLSEQQINKPSETLNIQYNEEQKNHGEVLNINDIVKSTQEKNITAKPEIIKEPKEINQILNEQIVTETNDIELKTSTNFDDLNKIIDDTVSKIKPEIQNSVENRQILHKIEEKAQKVEPQIIEPESIVIINNDNVIPSKKEHVELNILENQIIKPEKTKKDDNKNKVSSQKIEIISNETNIIKDNKINQIRNSENNVVIEKAKVNKDINIINNEDIENANINFAKVDKNQEKTMIVEEKNLTKKDIINQNNKGQEDLIQGIPNIQVQPKNTKTESIAENKLSQNVLSSQKEDSVILPPKLEITETPIKKEIKEEKISQIEEDVTESKIKEDIVSVVIPDILQKDDKSSNIIKHEPILAEKHAKEDDTVSENNIINTQPIKEEIKPQTQTSMSFNMGQESFESVLGKNNEIKESDKELEEDLAILSTNEENIAMAAANNTVQQPIQVTQIKNAKLANAVDPMSQLIADTNKQMQITRRILQKGETKTNFKPNNEVTYSEVVTEIEEVTPTNDSKPTVVKESHVEQKTVVKEKTVKVKPETMPQKDVNFVLTLTKTDSINLAETLINQTEQGEQTAQNSAISNRLLELIKKAMNENKPLRLDFDNNISVIIKISKEGKISADFIPGDKAVENYLRNNIPLLKQQFENKNIEYDDLTHQNAKQQKDKDNTKNKKEQKNE